ncbi:Ribosomal protein/NADH dehydrogenase domain-containing protein [Plasmodiophora brassicae]
MSRRLMPIQRMSHVQFQEYLRDWKRELNPTIRSIAVKWPAGIRAAAPRIFVRDYLPVLQFHNTHIKWTRTKSKDVAVPEIIAEFNNGQHESITMEGVPTALQIFDAVSEKLGRRTASANES